MLMDVYNFIFISKNTFGMHQSFFRELLGQLVALRKMYGAPVQSWPPCHAEEDVIVAPSPRVPGEEAEEDSSVCRVAYFNWTALEPSRGGNGQLRCRVSYKPALSGMVCPFVSSVWREVSHYIKQQEPHLLLQAEVWLEKGGHQLINPATEWRNLEIPSEGCPTHRPFVLSFLRRHFKRLRE